MSLEEIIAGESKTIEFKEELPADSKKYMKTVVAFSNTAGGKIIIGISDKWKFKTCRQYAIEGIRI